MSCHNEAAMHSDIVAALDRIVDPCSKAMGEPLGLHEMGLAHDIRISTAGDVDVRLRLTSACCSYGPMLAAAAEREVGELVGVRTARVRIEHDAMWTPVLIGAPAAARLEQRRASVRQDSTIRPYDWTSHRRRHEIQEHGTP